MRLDGWLLAVCIARTCMTSVFMTYAAVLPVLRTQWEMSATAAGSISTGFQLGYAVALDAFSALADRVGARRVFLGSAWLSAVTAIAFGLWARSYATGLVLCTLMALSQGGTYTTAIVLIADRYPPERRGAAVGWAAYLSAAFHLTGLVASSSMGRLSDRLGRKVVLVGLAATSAACSLVFGWLVTAPIAVVFVVGALYGFTALGDSPVLSTPLTEAVSAPYLGAALALRSFLGFGAGAVAPIVFGRILDLTNVPGPSPTTWGWAFVVLAGGGLLAAYSASGLASDRLRVVRAKAPSV